MKSIKIVFIIVVLALLADTAFAVNNQPVSNPIVNPATIYQCVKNPQPTLDGSGSYDSDKEPLVYQWYLNKKLYAEGKVVKIGPEITDKVDSYIFTLTVTDSGGASHGRDIVFTVMTNVMPNIKELKYAKISGSGIKDRNFLMLGDIFQLDTVMDGTGPVELIWKYNEKIFQKIGNGSAAKFKVISESYSSQKIEAVAMNACGVESNRGEISLEIRASEQNTPPTSTIEPPPNIFEGKRFQLFSSGSKTGKGVQEQGDRIVSWRWEIAEAKGNVLFRSAEQNPKFTIENSGLFLAHLWVTDSFGAIGYGNLTFAVAEAENDPPVADASATQKVAVFGKTFALNASKSWDPDGRPADAIKRYVWQDLTYQEELCSSSRSICVVIFNRTGTHNLRLTVYDSHFPSVERSADMQVSVKAEGAESLQNAQPSPTQEIRKNATSAELAAHPMDAPINPQELLENGSAQPIQKEPENGAKTIPGLRAVAAIIAIVIIATIAKKIRN